MDEKILLPEVSLPTFEATKGPLPCVPPVVDFEVVFALEGFATDGTLHVVLLGIFSCSLTVLLFVCFALGYALLCC